MPNITSMLVAAHDIKAQLDVLLLRGRVQDSGEHRVAATLCLTIAEQFAATLHLIEGGFSSHAPVMVRSMLEGHANLLNVVKDSTFVEQIRYDNARAEKFGYRPKHDAETQAAHAEAEQKKLAADPVADAYQGGGFCAIEYTADMAGIMDKLERTMDFSS